MADPTQATPLLLTKRLTAFLRANQTPQLPTLLLTTSQGKLLAHASSQPVAVLRTHGTVAASLLSIHTSSSVALPSALPGAATPDQQQQQHGSSPPPSHDGDADDDEATARGTDDEADAAADGTQQHPSQAQQHQDGNSKRTPSQDSVKPVTITVQLSGGTVVIRRLKCGLLLVCVGPSVHDDGSSQQRHADASSGSESGAGGVVVSTAPGSNDTESLKSAQTTTSLDSAAATSVAAMRKHANNLARWLDDKLGLLNLPDDGTVFG
ncbi:hypothetical protein K4F52_006972 [Lecanicillium sp. MT-2017a]|nr:hypothetical protein K4F52_006972 [Lecanicillium sp. MT-2017a]